MRPSMESGLLLRRIALSLAILVVLPHFAAAQTGTVAGTVTEKDGKTPIPLATITVLGTARGTMGEDDGKFVLRNVPVGTRTLKILQVGYPNVLQEVLVKAGETTFVKIRMSEAKAVKQLDVILVTANKSMIDTHTTQTKYGMDPKALTLISVDNVQQLAALQPGVVNQGGQLHVRGGRSDELKMRISGIEVSDPLNGGLPEIANPMVESANLITGGVDAKYGNALS